MMFLRTRRTSCSSSSPLKTVKAHQGTPMRGRQPINNVVTEAAGGGHTEPPMRTKQELNKIPKDRVAKDPSGAGARLESGEGPVDPQDFGDDPSRAEAADAHTEDNAETSAEPKLEQERRRLAEIKAQIEEEVKEQTELLRLLRSRREKVVEQGERLRRSVSPEKRPATPRSRFSTPDPKTPPPSPSPARKACNEAYDRMSPLMQHLAREQMHREGLRPRDTRREREERRDWGEYQKKSQSHTRAPGMSSKMPREESTARDHIRNRRVGEMQGENAVLRNKWHDAERQKIHDAWWNYEASWASWNTSPPSRVRLGDIPWPVSTVFLQVPPPTVDSTTEFEHMLSPSAISKFLFSIFHSDGKTRKQRLREALLRFHPDRFESRWLGKVSEEHGEREQVQEVVGLLVRNLAKLLEAEQ